jgi:uncharacterized Rmd1/YagE family protein
MRCVSYCTADSYNLSALVPVLKSQGCNVKQYRKVLQVAYNKKETNIFIFSYGCIVCWGLRKKEEQKFLELITPFAIKPLAVVESNRFIYRYGEETTITTHRSFNADIIILESESVPTKLAVSYALAQSIQLESYETAIQKTIDENAHLPQELVSTGSITLSKKDIIKRIGKIFSARSLINLGSDYLEDPEYFWEHPSTESYYTMVKKFLDIRRRVATLNQKLDVLHELFEILTNQLQHRHSSIMEITIIVLITIEVILSVVNMFNGY